MGVGLWVSSLCKNGNAIVMKACDEQNRKQPLPDGRGGEKGEREGFPLPSNAAQSLLGRPRPQGPQLLFQHPPLVHEVRPVGRRFPATLGRV